MQDPKNRTPGKSIFHHNRSDGIVYLRSTIACVLDLNKVVSLLKPSKTDARHRAFMMTMNVSINDT